MSKNKFFKVFVLALLVFAVALPIVGCADGDIGSADTYTLTLNYNDEVSRNGAVYVVKGESAAVPDEPLRQGYSFGGWYTAASGGDEVTFPYTPSADVELFAHWDAGVCTVTFALDYPSAPASQTLEVEYNHTVSAPTPNPSREGYVFRYWTLISGSRTEVTFPYMVTGDTTFYASWRDENIRLFNITLDYGEYENSPEDYVYQVEEGDAFLRSQVVTAQRSGYALTGWTYASDNEPVSFPFTPTGDVVLNAVWTRQEYSLQFRYNYVDAPSESYVVVPFGADEELNAPEVPPERAGYTFAGWYTAAQAGRLIEFPTTLDRNGIYYAHWTSNPVTTDVFHAEYVTFNPTTVYPGNSGSAEGNDCIIAFVNNGVMVDDYPMNTSRTAGHGYVVSFQYTPAAILQFTIVASEAMTGVSLFANWATERTLTFGPTGENAYVVLVNNSSIEYTPVSLTAAAGGSGDNASIGALREVTLATNLTLRAGENTITMYPNNSNSTGTMLCSAPITDYIRLSYSGSNKLSWSPVYDNLDGKL